MLDGKGFSAQVIEHLKRTDLDVDVPFQIKGRSGVDHVFDIKVKVPNSSKSVVVKIPDIEHNNQNIILRTYVEVFDSELQDAILVVKGVLTAAAKELAQNYHLIVVESENAKEAATKLRKIVSQDIREVKDL